MRYRTDALDELRRALEAVTARPDVDDVAQRLQAVALAARAVEVDDADHAAADLADALAHALLVDAAHGLLPTVLAGLAARDDGADIAEALRTAANLLRSPRPTEVDLVAAGVLLEASRAVALLGHAREVEREVVRARQEIDGADADDFRDDGWTTEG